MNKKQANLLTDHLLVPAFLLTLWSGVALHVAGSGPHDAWHDRAVLHVVCSALFLLLGALHIRFHWGWYKGLFRGRMQGKSRVTALFSLLFAAAVLTGVWLLAAVEGADTPEGMLHYRTGLLAGLFGLLHLCGRLGTLVRMSRGERTGRRRIRSRASRTRTAENG